MYLSRFLGALIVSLAIATPALANDAQPVTSSSTEQTTTVTQTKTIERPKIDLNKASAKELLKIKGVNPSRARAIVNYRKKHGNFKSISELANVKGFKKLKQEKMNTIQNQLTIE